MASSAPQVQILDKSDYTKQHLVTLHNAHPLPNLTAGDIRIRSQIICNTINNFTYARIGHLFGWWDVWAAVPSLPAPYNDASKYGRVSSWGYCEVIESQNDKVPVGTKLYGYLPIGDYPEILQVTVEDETGHVLETSERRASQMHIYNRYLPYPPETDLMADKQSRGWDSVMRIFFETSYFLNRYVFAWDSAKRTHPLGVSLPWSLGDADLANAVVVLLGASGKTALSFAYQLRHSRPADHQPRKLVAVGSARSRSFTEATGLFDDLLLYTEVSSATDTSIAARLGIDDSTKVLLVNFGGRGTVDEELHTILTRLSKSVVALIVGGDPQGKGSKLNALTEVPGSGVVLCSASSLRDSAMRIDGKVAYFENLSQEWALFKENGAINGLKLQWGKGMEEYGKGWDSLCSGGIDPTLGLVYEV
ncbi:uncharacterized protein TRIVIDRAFT_215141 [Trichoderma virens Gv29-8]|uniref:Uncharacterized protein n=1 Tax=Hypocrea virens (strain Gv29-8 / FGSC 10586) TaxID=413071 RepID=G9MEI6_HYPVG|nr:uncharacterized protein TRIVIDRAFT_215141 [Trichoderma virens Gv29-8]EHK27466.1 hypothetical protein TRIVIDRAFT_215141 [Trichoderma virens Gv29-8]